MEDAIVDEVARDIVRVRAKEAIDDSAAFILLTDEGILISGQLQDLAALIANGLEDRIFSASLRLAIELRRAVAFINGKGEEGRDEE